MGRNDNGPVSPILVCGAAAVFVAVVLAYRCLAAPSFDSICRAWLLLPLLLG